MAKAGDEYVRTDGERLLFRQTAGDTGGDLLEMEVTYKPNSSRPPVHYHPSQKEDFEVLEGVIWTSINGQEKTFQAGDRFSVSAGVPHAMYNPGEGYTRMNWQVRPAMKSEDFFETVWGLAVDGKSGPDGDLGFLQSMVIGQTYSDEFRLSSPPYGVTRLLFAILAPIGRLIGYPDHYNKYGGES